MSPEEGILREWVHGAYKQFRQVQAQLRRGSERATLIGCPKLALRLKLAAFSCEEVAEQLRHVLEVTREGET